MRRATVTACLVTVMSAGAPLFAQQSAFLTAPRQQGSTATTPQAPAGPRLELSMDQAVTLAFENNLDLKSDRFTLGITAQGVALARAAFLPTLTGNLTRVTRTSVTTSQFESSSNTTKRTSLGTSTRFAQSLPWYGSSYNISWSGGRDTTTAFTNFNPTLNSSLTAQFNQPLWQRFGIDNNRYSVENAQRSLKIADLQLQQQIIALEDQVRQAYLSLTGAIASLAVAQENQRVNVVSLNNARARIAVGQAAEIDAIQSEAAVRSGEESVINAEANTAAAEDQLRALLLDPARPDYWQVHIIPTDQMELKERHVDVDAAIKEALANRLDRVVAQRQLEQVELGQKLTENFTKPSVDFQATYSASGTAGVLLQEGLPVATIGYGQALGDAFGNQNPSWTLGIQVGYPLGQTANRVALARSQIDLEQRQLNLRIQELQIVTQVRDAARQVETGFRRVQSTQLALTASEQQLRAEERKQEVGMSSQFDVIQKQQLLAQAKDRELSARISYNRALLNFDRVLKIR